MSKAIKSNILRNQKGSILASFVIILTILTSILLYAASTSLANKVGIERTINNALAMGIAEGGAEKAVWELKKGNYTGETASSDIQGGQFDVTVAGSGNVKTITVVSYVPSKANPKYKKAVKVKVTDDPDTDAIAFHYGVQVGDYGVNMENNGTKITGNVYSNGTITGQSKTKSEITGDVKVAGPGGKIEKVKVGGSAYAHIIQSCNIIGDAYYHSAFSDTAAHQYSNQPDPPPTELPITQAMIDNWEEAAEDGGTINGNYDISSPINLGPKKINGNLTISANTTITVTGPIWVTGNITTGSNVIFNLDPSYGANSSMIIADSHTDNINFGKIDVSNNVLVNGSGDPKSFIMLLSTNVATDKANPAIWTSPNASSAIYYAQDGWMDVKNNGKVKAIVGKGLYLSPNAEIVYDTGLADSNFSGGPGGTWQVMEWQEIKVP